MFREHNRQLRLLATLPRRGLCLTCLPKSCKYRQRWEAERENGRTKISKDDIANWTMARSPFCVVVLFFARSKFVGVAHHSSNRVKPYTPQEIVAACTGA
jgi:hypothetical protein